MTNILTSIDTYICKIEKQLPQYIYLTLCEIDIDTNKKNLLSIDETLTQYILKLDDNMTINRQERKQKIMKIQEIQKSIDKVMEINKNNIQKSNYDSDQNINTPHPTDQTSIDVELYKLKKIHDYIHQKNYEINELKLANAELRVKIHNLTNPKCPKYTRFV